jgi:general secretion pathway protein D
VTLTFTLLRTAAAAAAVLLGACAQAPRADDTDTGLRLMLDGRLEDSIVYLRALQDDRPGDAKTRALLALANDKLGTRRLLQAQQAQARGDAAAAQALLAEAEPLLARPEAASQLRGQWSPAQAQARVPTQARPPADAPGPSPTSPGADPQAQEHALVTRLTLHLSDASARTVFQSIARSAGVDVLFDPGIGADRKVSVALTEVSARTAFDRVAALHGLAWRLLDPRTVLVYDDAPVPRGDHQPLQVKGYRLQHGDVRVAAASLRTVLKFRDIMIDDKLNMLVVRDTAEALALADRLVALHDVPEPEVVLEVEVLEVSARLLQELGIEWPAQLSLAPLPVHLNRGTGLPFDPLLPTTARDLLPATPGRLSATLGQMALSARNGHSDVNTLASPRIRTRSREKARILVGERVPNISATATATGFVSENINYVDVGLKLEVEPQVFAGDEIVIRIALEVSSITERVQTRAGTFAYRIGTRNAQTVLRLKDGENQVLAGLVQDEDVRDRASVPGLADLPLVGRLFGHRSSTRGKSEIVLSITPRLVRGIAAGGPGRTQFDAGTASSLRGRVTEGGGTAEPPPVDARDAPPAGATTYQPPAPPPTPPPAPAYGGPP